MSLHAKMLGDSYARFHREKASGHLSVGYQETQDKVETEIINQKDDAETGVMILHECAIAKREYLGCLEQRRWRLDPWH